MNVLITGGTGFIGSHLSLHCSRLGYRTTIVDREKNLWDEWKEEFLSNSNCNFIQDDMISDKVLKRIENKEYEVIFHQAAIPRVSYSVEHPSETTDENVLKSVKLLEASSGNCRRFIFASSASVYGLSENIPTEEKEILDPQSPYALQKKVVEEFCRLFSSLYNIDTVCLRYFNCFGPRQTGNSAYSTAVSAWCNAIKNKIPLRKDGTGEQTRDMCFVSNVVNANILACNSKRIFKGDAFNIACGDSVSNNKILSFLKEKYPHITVKESPARIGDIMHSKASIEKAKKELGYYPSVYFWDGLKQTLDWWGL